MRFRAASSVVCEPEDLPDAVLLCVPRGHGAFANGRMPFCNPSGLSVRTRGFVFNALVSNHVSAAVSGTRKIMLPIARTRWQWTFLVGLGLGSSGACATDHA